MQKYVNLVDLVKNSNEYLFSKIGFDTAENESCEVCQKIVRQLDKLSQDKRMGAPMPSQAAVQMTANPSFPAAVHSIAVLVTVPLCGDFKGLQTSPPAEWNASTKQLLWKCEKLEPGAKLLLKAKIATAATAEAAAKGPARLLAHAKFVLPNTCFGKLEFKVAPPPGASPSSVRLAKRESKCRVSLKAK